MIVVVSYRESPIASFYVRGELTVTYGGRTIVSVNLPFGSTTKKLLTKDKVMSTDVVFTAQDFIKIMQTYAKLMDSDVEIACTGDNAAVFLSTSTQAELEAITTAVTKLVSELGNVDTSSILSTQSDALLYRIAHCMANATGTCYATGDAVKYMAAYLEGTPLSMSYVEALVIAIRTAYLGSDVVAHTLMQANEASTKLCAWMSSATTMTFSVSSAANALPTIRITSGSTLSADFVGELSPKAVAAVNALGTSAFIASAALQVTPIGGLGANVAFELSADALLRACYMSRPSAFTSDSLISSATLTAEPPTPPEPTMYQISFNDFMDFGGRNLEFTDITFWFLVAGTNYYCQGFRFFYFDRTIGYLRNDRYTLVYYSGWYDNAYKTIYTTPTEYPNWPEELKNFITRNAIVTPVY